MNKKLLMIFLISSFLITAVGVISAADIPVEVVWEGDNAPDYVTVNLIKDGEIVDTVKLSSDNSWKITFHVDDDREYNINESDSGVFSSSISGNASSGFVITNTILKEEVLNVVADDNTEDFSSDELSQNDTSLLTDNETDQEEVYNSTDDNNSTSENTENEETDDAYGDVTSESDNSSDDETTNGDSSNDVVIVKNTKTTNKGIGNN